MTAATMVHAWVNYWRETEAKPRLVLISAMHLAMATTVQNKTPNIQTPTRPECMSSLKTVWICQAKEFGESEWLVLML